MLNGLGGCLSRTGLVVGGLATAIGIASYKESLDLKQPCSQDVRTKIAHATKLIPAPDDINWAREHEIKCKMMGSFYDCQGMTPEELKESYRRVYEATLRLTLDNFSCPYETSSATTIAFTKHHFPNHIFLNKPPAIDECTNAGIIFHEAAHLVEVDGQTPWHINDTLAHNDINPAKFDFVYSLGAIAKSQCLATSH